MEHAPSHMPDGDLNESSAADLMNTIQGLCNESTLKRTEIIGALETVKIAMLMNWRAALCGEEDED